MQKFARYTEDEAAELQRGRREAGLSDASFIRASTIGDPGPRSKRAMPTAQDQLTAAHHIAVKRIGVNVNQGIHALNEIALKAPRSHQPRPAGRRDNGRARNFAGGAAGGR